MTLLLCNDAIEKALLNAVICSTQHNEIMERTIKGCAYNVLNKLGKSPLDITGPIFFYKSINKYINNDNILLQNNRPPNDFHDFTNDYVNNNITLIGNKKVILNRFYKGYYDNYLNTIHYGKLVNDGEVYYKNFQNINNIRLCIYPNKYNDRFIFQLKNLEKDNEYLLIIKRIDSHNGWLFNLKVIIILTNNKEYLIEVGISKTNKKEIKINIF
jgi:hypothetical protein